MNALVYLIMIAVFIYTLGFSIQLWKDKEKSGSIAVFVLALLVIIAPFFSVLRW